MAAGEVCFFKQTEIKLFSSSILMSILNNQVPLNFRQLLNSVKEITGE